MAPRTPTPHPPTPDSPIDYERAALRVEFYEANPLVPDPDQENVPLAPIIRPPSCLRDTTVHPHQHLTIWTPRGEEIIPIGETHQFSINILRPIGDLNRRPPRFPGVTPFRIPSPHCIAIYPSNYTPALAVGVQPLYACSKAILDLPSEDIPLGSIRYCFREGIWNAFAPLNRLILEAYNLTLVTLEVHDFLDGRVVTKYGYLTFGTTRYTPFTRGILLKTRRGLTLIYSISVSPQGSQPTPLTTCQTTQTTNPYNY